MKKQLAFYKVQKDIVDKLTKELKFNIEVLDKMRLGMIEEMNKQGIKRVVNEEIKVQAIMNTRKGFKIDRERVLRYFKDKGIDRLAYMDVSMPKINNLVKQLQGKGEKVDGIEQSAKDYLTIREL